MVAAEEPLGGVEDGEHVAYLLVLRCVENLDVPVDLDGTRGRPLRGLEGYSSQSFFTVGSGSTNRRRHSSQIRRRHDDRLAGGCVGVDSLLRLSTSIVRTGMVTRPAYRDRRKDSFPRRSGSLPQARTAELHRADSAGGAGTQARRRGPATTPWSPIKICSFDDFRHTILCSREWTARG